MEAKGPGLIGGSKDDTTLVSSHNDGETGKVGPPGNLTGGEEGVKIDMHDGGSRFITSPIAFGTRRPWPCAHPYTSFL
jgi:hypothetical protein